MTDSPANQTDDAKARRRAPDSELGLVLAWLASIAVHLVLFTVMVAVPWINNTAGAPATHDVTATALRDLPKHPKFSMVPEESPFAQQPRPEQQQTRITPEQQRTLRDLAQAARPRLSVVGIGTGGGDFAKYGLHVGTGAVGPQFFGLGGEARAARRIVYVVDRSGSMLGVFGDLRRELKRSIDRLRKSQKYHVIFYSTDPPVEASPKRLVNAIRASKEKTFDFIDQITPGGMTQPIEAMRRAFALEPDLVYFLSDGDIPEAALLKENLRLWNRQENVRIFTIAYVSSAGRELLEDIAREHNGAFRFVSEYELEG